MRRSNAIKKGNYYKSKKRVILLMKKENTINEKVPILLVKFLCSLVLL